MNHVYIFSFLTISIVVAAVLYGCESSSKRYWQSYNECIASGGSVIPLKQNENSSIICLQNQSVKPVQ
jgi:hypothetical protein